MRKYLLILLLLPTISFAVSISPRKVIVAGKQGSIASLQFEVYGHGEDVDIEFAKVEDLRLDKDKVLSTFVLSREQRYVMPIDIRLTKNAEYYLCAVLKGSKSMRLRTCSKITVKID